MSTQHFESVVGDIYSVGKNKHSQALIDHAKFNKPFIFKSIKDLELPQDNKAKKAIVICAGPSLKKKFILKKLASSNYEGSI